MRVVSLVPSVTETLRAWGLDPVGCTRFCEQPDLPAVGGTKNPDIARIVSLRPELVVLDEEENRFEDAVMLERAGIQIHVTAVRSLAGVAPTLASLAEAVGAPAPAMELPPPVEPSLRAYVPIWRRPWMTINGDTYGSSLLSHAGAVNVFDEHADRYPSVGLDEARARLPDVVLAPSEPYAFGLRHVSELETVARTMLVDGKDLFWWGVRTPEAARRLISLVARQP